MPIGIDSGHCSNEIWGLFHQAARNASYRHNGESTCGYLIPKDTPASLTVSIPIALYMTELKVRSRDGSRMAS